MTRLVMLRIVCACAVFVAGACFAAPPADLDRYAGRTLEAVDVPGMTVAIVEQGRPSVVRSYGVRKMGESAKVDEHTLFAIEWLVVLSPDKPHSRRDHSPAWARGDERAGGSYADRWWTDRHIEDAYVRSR